MLYRVGTRSELAILGSKLPERVYTELFQGIIVLDAEYGQDRDPLLVGGYSLIAENLEDVSNVKKIVDYDNHPPEWATRLGSSGYASALFILNNDFNIMVYLPEAIAPEAIKRELEEQQ